MYRQDCHGLAVPEWRSMDIYAHALQWLHRQRRYWLDALMLAETPDVQQLARQEVAPLEDSITRVELDCTRRRRSWSVAWWNKEPRNGGPLCRRDVLLSDSADSRPDTTDRP